MIILYKKIKYNINAMFDFRKMLKEEIQRNSYIWFCY